MASAAWAAARCAIFDSISNILAFMRSIICAACACAAFSTAAASCRREMSETLSSPRTKR